MHYRDFIADNNRPCAVAAHRGAWSAAPENSIASIENAIGFGCDIVELDVRMSADGVLFLMHDANLNRVAGIERDVSSMTMAELKRVRLRQRNGGDGHDLTDHAIPTLEEALECLKGRIFADLDLKDRSLFPEATRCIQEMSAVQYVDLKTTIANDADVDWVKRQALGKIPFMALCEFEDATFNDTFRMLKDTSAFMCEIRFDDLATVAYHKDDFANAGISLWRNTLGAKWAPWTDKAASENPDLIWGRLIEAGISVIQTDQPELLHSYTRKRKAAA
ncbi:glycerophosphodiester phosphodiesterase family protein [Ensifer sp. ENS02]|uniref:glycerophosphodiester phosphodiesterase family protein n=1 Tax=Ensifer sp. ENS02 TaxID=2769290 RepID=UPI00177DFF03|nr:glycerophosphodiester phosphodiesterase family protein [Ensifer sp. ENS02]MBD9525095.1 glycerophosphodiester phosphodiesterase family protein [Ensifer sp. ENS02]